MCVRRHRTSKNNGSEIIWKIYWKWDNFQKISIAGNINRFFIFVTVYGRGEDEEMNEDWEYGDAIGKCEPTTDQEDNDEDAYTDASDPE